MLIKNTVNSAAVFRVKKIQPTLKQKNTKWAFQLLLFVKQFSYVRR